MTTNVYCNFPEINIPMEGASYDKMINLPTNKQPTTNIKLNDVTYCARSICIFSNTSTTPTHLVVKCNDDITNPDKFVYFAIPLDSSGATTNSIVDDIIDASGKSTNIKFDLNRILPEERECYINNINEQVTIVTETTISVKSYIGKKYINDLNRIDVIKKTKNGKLIKQSDLDWIMTCELLTEDDGGPTNKDKLDPDSTATTISFLMMAILIAAVAHASGPIFYQSTGMIALVNKGNGVSHYSINMYWRIILFVLAWLCVGQGVVTQKNIYYFLGIALVLSYFSGTRSILDMDNNDVEKDENTKWFKTNGKSMFGVFTELYSKGWSVSTVVFGLWLASFGTIIAGLPLKNDIAFITGLSAFLICSIVLLKTLS